MMSRGKPDCPGISDEDVDACRAALHKALGLSAQEGKTQYDAALFREFQRRSGDPDQPLVQWVAEGFPLGIYHSIEAG
eukprot:2980940-Amphidinium_carterae.1